MCIAVLEAWGARQATRTVSSCSSNLDLNFTNENGICILVDVSLTKAILRYKGALAVDPVTNSTPGVKMNDADMHVRNFRVCSFRFHKKLILFQPIAQAGPGNVSIILLEYMTWPAHDFAP